MCPTPQPTATLSPAGQQTAQAARAAAVNGGQPLASPVVSQPLPPIQMPSPAMAPADAAAMINQMVGLPAMPAPDDLLVNRVSRAPAPTLVPPPARGPGANRVAAATGAPVAPQVPLPLPRPTDLPRMNAAQWERHVNNLPPGSAWPAVDFLERQAIIRDGYLPGQPDVRSPNAPPPQVFDLARIFGGG